MDDIASVRALYDQAIGNGQPQELISVAERIREIVKKREIEDTDRLLAIALTLHLRGVAYLSTDEDEQLADCLAEIRSIVAADSPPAVQAVHAILTFCCYYTTKDAGLLGEALRLFAARADTSSIPRLETAALINEVRTHSLALSYSIPGHSADRVEVLVDQLCAGALAPRLEAILADTIGAFYGRLAAIYGDVRFLRQGTSLLEPMLQRENATVSDAALGAVWHLLTTGLEFDANFTISRDLLRRSQRRVRQARTHIEAQSREVCSIAAGLALRARFDWERHGKRSGVQRALGYLRVASRDRAHETLFATTLRVAYEAGLGEHYLQNSLEVFERMRARPGFRSNTPDDTNFASTLMVVGNDEKDPARLRQAIGLYEGAIAREPDSATNVSRYINLAAAIRSYVRLSASAPENEEAIDELWLRGLDAVIWAGVLDRPGSTHAGMHLAISSNYHSLFAARMGEAAHPFFLQRTIEIFAGREDRWPIGFARYLAKRIVTACESDVDCDLLAQCAEALGRAKFLLQVIDLCDGGDALTEEIDGIFCAAVAMLRLFIAEGRDEDGLRVLDRLTAGFVRQVTPIADQMGDETFKEIMRRSIAGEALSPNDIARVRRSSFGSLAGPEDVPLAPSLSPSPQVHLLRAGGEILALRLNASGLAARLFTARRGTLSSSDPEVVAGLAGFCLEAGITTHISFRNFQPLAAHDLFAALRSQIEAEDPGRRLLRHAARCLGAQPETLQWNDHARPPRFLIAHSPANQARPLSFGFTVASRVRGLGAEVVELSLDECRREAISHNLADADIVLIVSHGERGASDRILLAGDDYADAAWLLELGDRLRDKCLFLVACNSGHFNARLTHDDIGLAPLAIGLGARGVFSTLRSVDELSILLLIEHAFIRWRSGIPLGVALDESRVAILAFDRDDWGLAVRDFLRSSPGSELSARISLDMDEPRLAADRADVDVGWAFVLG